MHCNPVSAGERLAYHEPCIAHASCWLIVPLPSVSSSWKTARQPATSSAESALAACCIRKPLSWDKGVCGCTAGWLGAHLAFCDHGWALRVAVRAFKLGAVPLCLTVASCRLTATNLRLWQARLLRLTEGPATRSCNSRVSIPAWSADFLH